MSGSDSLPNSALQSVVRDDRRAPPLIAHVLFHLGIGGMENGVVNLINHMPRQRYRHAIVCVRGKTDFDRRVTRDDVPIITLGQKPGIDFGSYARAWRTFRELKPDLVHTRNLAALEMQLPAALAGVPARVHSEHGRDGRDLHGDYRPYNFLRKAYRPLVHRYVAMSRNLQRWLIDTIAIDGAHVAQIYNGVDTRRFAPLRHAEPRVGPAGFFSGASFVVGAVGRIVPIKDHDTLVRGFARLVATAAAAGGGLRLILVGDGPGRAACEQLARELGIAQQCWFAGDRDDVELILRQLDVFCLTSLNEGINNTLLEAMASGLPIVATAVGGNPELVVDGQNGHLIPARDPEALAGALLAYLRDATMRAAHGAAGRDRATRAFSLDAMVANYMALYDGLLAARSAKASSRIQAGRVL